MMPSQIGHTGTPRRPPRHGHTSVPQVGTRLESHLRDGAGRRGRTCRWKGPLLDLIRPDRRLSARRAGNSHLSDGGRRNKAITNPTAITQ